MKPTFAEALASNRAYIFECLRSQNPHTRASSLALLATHNVFDEEFIVEAKKLLEDNQIAGMCTPVSALAREYLRLAGLSKGEA